MSRDDAGVATAPTPPSGAVERAHSAPSRAVDRLRARLDLVIGAGLVMVLGQAVFRGWALYGSWFYLDDYSLLLEADRQERPGLEYLVEPWNSHLMPAGRLVAWVVAHSGTLNWTLAASLTLALQVVCGLAALWMLVTLFGARWGVLAPLGLYLTSAMTVPALMWWTAALNQLAMQAGFFLAVGAWVHYLRGGRRAWAAAAYAGVGLGLLFDVKALLIVGVLAFVTLAYFTTGTPVARLRDALSRFWAGALMGLLPLAAYVAYYTHRVDQPFEPVSLELSLELAQSMLGRAFVSGTLGGPWQWVALAPPNSFADPPGWLLTVAWVVGVLVVLYGALRRERTGRAWLLLAGYLAALLGLLLTSRAPVYGDLIGLEYRYLTDVTCVLALCTGLAFLPLSGAAGSSAPRSEPVLRWQAGVRWTSGLTAIVCASGLISSVGAIDHWHHDNASEEWTRNLRSDLRSYGAVDLSDQAVPDAVYSSIFAPDNRLSRFTPLMSSLVSYPEATSRLAAVASDGGLRQAAIGDGTRSVPGPVDGCGWPVRAAGTTIPLAGDAFDYDWWLRIGYLADVDSPITVSAGRSQVQTTVLPGLNSLFVHVQGGFSEVRISGLSAAATMCVDVIEVGQPVAAGPLS